MHDANPRCIGDDKQPNHEVEREIVNPACKHHARRFEQADDTRQRRKSALWPRIWFIENSGKKRKEGLEDAEQSYHNGQHRDACRLGPERIGEQRQPSGDGDCAGDVERFGQVIHWTKTPHMQCRIVLFHVD